MTNKNPDAAAKVGGAHRHSGDVKEFFDSFATSYGQGRYFELRRAAVFQALAPYLERASRILDLGCGNGIYLVELCQLGKPYRPVGMDLSEAMLRQAREHVGNHADFVRADAVAIPFRENCWDLVICSHVLLFIKELHHCVADITRSLRPGGMLVATTAPNLLVRLRQLLGKEVFAEFDHATTGTLVATEPMMSEEGYRQAYLDAGLRIELLTPHFELDHGSVESSLRSILARFVEPDAVKRTLDSVRAALVGRTLLPLTEPLLIGTKSA
jgi:ubiquinone/menaquinone biosynthesis C-methylase UbiE